MLFIPIIKTKSWFKIVKVQLLFFSIILAITIALVAQFITSLLGHQGMNGLAMLVFLPFTIPLGVYFVFLTVVALNYKTRQLIRKIQGESQTEEVAEDIVREDSQLKIEPPQANDDDELLKNLENQINQQK